MGGTEGVSDAMESLQAELQNAADITEAIHRATDAAMPDHLGGSADTDSIEDELNAFLAEEEEPPIPVSTDPFTSTQRAASPAPERLPPRTPAEGVTTPTIRKGVAAATRPFDVDEGALKAMLES
jgi:hypothetical protein